MKNLRNITKYTVQIIKIISLTHQSLEQNNNQQKLFWKIRNDLLVRVCNISVPLSIIKLLWYVRHFIKRFLI